MTTTAAPALNPDRQESEERPILSPVPVHTTPAEPEARSFDPTQGRRIGAYPYDDPTQGIGSHPYDDPTQGRVVGSDHYDDPTRGRRIGSHSYDDPTQGRKVGSDPYDDPIRAR
jgi:hypothetical protein